MKGWRVSAQPQEQTFENAKSMFNKGVGWKLASHNPTDGITLLRENGARTRFLDGHEIGQLLAASSESFHPILITALHTGMRRGEILNLKWPDVDFKNRIITVQDSESGKKRMLPMDDTLCEALSLLPTRFQRGYVFPSPVKEGQPRYDFKRQFGNAVKQAGLHKLPLSRPETHIRITSGDVWSGPDDCEGTTGSCHTNHDHEILPPGS